MDMMGIFLLLGAFVLGALTVKFLLPSGTAAQAALKAKYEAAVKQCADAQDKCDELNDALMSAREQIATLKSERESLEQRLKEHQADIEARQKLMQQQFENLANQILERSSRLSQERILEQLKPFREKLEEFKKNVSESFSQQAKEQFSLKNEIEKIVKTNQDMRLQTENLTKALKGDVKAQGTWGEVILERILEDAGLTRGNEYIIQGMEMGLKHVEDGSALKPDVVVKLPDGKHIIIDSKVSLTHYERFCQEESEPARGECLKLYLASIKAHVNGLAQRRYQDTDKLNAPDFVFMFMPIEGAFSLAVQQDQEIHAYAWDKKVVIVCPSMLFASLKTIASLWKIETQNRYAQDIAKRGGELYDKMAGFVEDMERIKKHLDNANDAYDAAIGKLSKGRGNVLRQIEQMKTLGAKASKSLPVALIDQEEEGAEVLPLVSA